MERVPRKRLEQEILHLGHVEVDRIGLLGGACPAKGARVNEEEALDGRLVTISVDTVEEEQGLRDERRVGHCLRDDLFAPSCAARGIVDRGRLGLVEVAMVDEYLSACDCDSLKVSLGEWRTPARE